ncbi:MAG TPA: regulatory protein RecX [Polyangiaceae bacterium]
MSTKAPKSLNRADVEERALSYLNRFDASAARLTRVLEQFVRRRAKELELDVAPFLDVVNETVERYQRSGLLDDRRFSEAMARNLAQRGASRQAIKAKLSSRGIASNVIDEVVGGLAQEVGSELDVAKSVVKKRKLGQMRPSEERRAHYRRDLGILARAGFDLDTAKLALNVESSDGDDEF